MGFGGGFGGKGKGKPWENWQPRPEEVPNWLAPAYYKEKAKREELEKQQEERDSREKMEAQERRLTDSVNNALKSALGAIDGFGSFIGSPYVFTRYEDAKRYAGLGREETTFLLCQTTFLL